MAGLRFFALRSKLNLMVNLILIQPVVGLP